MASRGAADDRSRVRRAAPAGTTGGAGTAPGVAVRARRPQPRPGRRAGHPLRRRRRHRRRPLRQRRQRADHPALGVGHRRGQRRHDVRDHRRRHRPVGRRDRRAGVGLGDHAGDPVAGRGHALDRHGVRGARRGRVAAGWSTACSSPTAGSSPFIATLAMLAAARGLAEIIAKRRTQIVTRPDFIDFFARRACSASRCSSSSSRSSPSAGWVLLNRTTFGRRTFAVGGNPEAARLAGIHVRRHTVLLYVLVGLCCGIAAVMIWPRTTTGTLDPRHALRARRDRRRRHRRHAAQRRPRHDRRHRPRRAHLHARSPTSSPSTTCRHLDARPSPRASSSSPPSCSSSASPPAPQHRDARTARETRPPRRHRTRRPTARHRTSPAHKETAMSAPLTPLVGLARQRAARRAPPAPPAAPSNEPDGTTRRRAQRRPAGAATRNDDPGETVVIGFSGPAADHGWLAAINNAAEAEADEVPRRRASRRPRAPTTPTSRSARSRPSSTTRSTRSCCCPTDGAALTEVATKAMEAGIPVINVDREFSSPFAARTTILGDNYGMGVSAGTYVCKADRGQGLTEPGRSPRSPASTRCR